jgi:hypothetical protein
MSSPDVGSPRVVVDEPDGLAPVIRRPPKCLSFNFYISLNTAETIFPLA